jgi:hypothetical protein
MGLEKADAKEPREAPFSRNQKLTWAIRERSGRVNRKTGSTAFCWVGRKGRYLSSGANLVALI